MASIVVVTMIAGMASLLLSVGRANQQELESVQADVKAFYLAEAGLNEALLSMSTSLSSDGDVAMPTAMGSAKQPHHLHQGDYWTSIVDNGDGTYTVTSTGESVDERCSVEAVVQVPDTSSVYHNALFAGNRSENPLYTLGFGGSGGQADVINGNVYSGGNVAVSGGAVVNGSIRATGSISGADGDSGETAPIPDLQAMNYEVDHDYDVAGLFASAAWQYDSAGGSAWQLPEDNPAHSLRKNPSDRKKETGSTVKDDYFLEDPHEKVRVDKNQNGKNAYHLTLTNSHGKGPSTSNKVYYIDGNLWLHNKKTYSFKFYQTQNESTKITVVVKGNIYFSDNLFYQNKNKDGIAFIALADEAVPDSGNIYFGDPEFGTLKEMNAFMYAENDFYDYNLDALGSATVRVFGNMTAGEHISIERDYLGQHSKLTVDFDDRLMKGDLSLPGLPSESSGQDQGLTLLSWRRVNGS